jgi:ubiquinone/menaquinone biosynthesis C-methylase UbiE
VTDKPANGPKDHPIVKAAELQSGDCVLEIGFRQVRAMQSFAKIVGDQGSVTGLDIDPEHVVNAQKALGEGASTNIHAVEGSILNLPFPDETFDVIFCLGVLHEIRDLNRAFLEIARVLRPNGRVVMADCQRFSRIKFALYRAQVRLRGESCSDVHPGFTHQSLTVRLKKSGLCESTYQTLDGEWRLGFIRSGRFLLVADKRIE